MKVVGIGNAIVDVLCKVDDQFITDHGLTKGTMKLIDEQEFIKLQAAVKIESTVSGPQLRRILFLRQNQMNRLYLQVICVKMSLGSSPNPVVTLSQMMILPVPELQPLLPKFWSISRSLSFQISSELPRQ